MNVITHETTFDPPPMDFGSVLARQRAEQIGAQQSAATATTEPMTVEHTTHTKEQSGTLMALSQSQKKRRLSTRDVDAPALIPVALYADVFQR